MAYDTLLLEDFDVLNIYSEFAEASSALSNSFTLSSNAVLFFMFACSFYHDFSIIGRGRKSNHFFG